MIMFTDSENSEKFFERSDKKSVYLSDFDEKNYPEKAIANYQKIFILINPQEKYNSILK